MKKGNYAKLRKDATVKELLEAAEPPYHINGFTWDYLTAHGSYIEEYKVLEIEDGMATLETSDFAYVLVSVSLLEVSK